MLIDIRTVHLVVAFLQFMLPLGMLLSLVAQRNAENYWWCFLSSITGIGSILFVLRGLAPAYISIFLAQALLIFGLLGQNCILMRWLNKFNRKVVILYVLLAIGYLICLFMFLMLQVSLRYRLIISVFVFIVVLIQRLLLGSELERSVSKSAGRMFIASALLNMMSILMRVFDANYIIEGVDLFRVSIFSLLSLLMFTTGILLLHFAYMELLIKKNATDLINAIDKNYQISLKHQLLEDKMDRREQQFNQLASNAGIHGFAAFSGAIAHEIAQPLAAMQLNIDRMIHYLCKMKDEPRLLAELEGVKSDNNRAINIIQSIRLLLDNDSALISDSTIDINVLVRDAVYMSRKKIINKRITYTQHYSLGVQKIPGDHGLILQVVINLINNAISATSQVKEPQINLSVMDNSDYVFLVISDNGCGINSSDADFVFQPFKSISKEGRALGLGLGLSIIQSIVKKHNGDVGYINNAVSGVTFIIGLPKTVETVSYVFEESLVRDLLDSNLLVGC